MEKEVAVSIINLNKSFKLKDKGASISQKIKNIVLNKSRPNVKIIKDLSIDIYKGEFIGIIGKNGSGKSTLLKLIIGAIAPDKGTKIVINGKVIRLALGIGFDANLSARDNIYVNGVIIGLSMKEIGEKLDEILDFSELHEFIDTPVRFFSSGMKSRLSFAIALHTEADIILIDEFFGAVGDQNFKQKSQKAFEENILNGKTIIHVTHSMQTIKNHCDKVLLMNESGATIFEDAQKAIHEYAKLK